MEEIESVSRVWSEDLASQASRLGFARLLDFSAPSVIQAHSVAAPLHCVVCKDTGQCQPLAVGVLDFSLQLLADVALLLYARGPLVAHLLQDLLSGLRWGILSHLAPEMVQGEGGCVMPAAILAPFRHFSRVTPSERRAGHWIRTAW